jgi:hypothetical protein
MKFFRRALAFFAILAVAFRAVGSFLSWAQRQEDAPADAWIDEDEDELEDAYAILAGESSLAAA